MAKVAFGGGVTGIRGKVGGVVYSANGSGAYVKRFARPRLIATAAQKTQRVTLATKAAEWDGLTQAQRDDWNDWAALPAQEQTDSLGQAYYISGFAWYVKWNLWRSTTGQSSRSDAPTDTQPAAPTISTLSVTAGAAEPPAEVLITFPLFTFDGYGVSTMTLRPSPGNTTPFAKPALWANIISDLESSFDMTTETLDAYGEIVAGTNWILQIHHQTTQGYRSPPTTIIAEAA